MKTLIPTVITSALLTALPLLDARTQAEQQAMKPQEVLDILMDGNERFVSGNAAKRDLLQEASDTAAGQYPIAVILSCLDSRVPVEMVFDQGIGDVFVGRVAGNVEDQDMVGSLEFATKVAGAKLILVMGHESCGAVRGAIADVELGNLTQLLEKIQPAIYDVKDFSGKRDASNRAFVDAVAAKNVPRTIREIRDSSPIITELESNGDIMIVGAMYDLETGKVILIDETDTHSYHDESHMDSHGHAH